MKNNLKNTKTLDNLVNGYLKECQAYARYSFFKEKAMKENLQELVQIFDKIATNEKAHAKVYLDFLKNYECAIEVNYAHTVVKSSKENLEQAIDIENIESQNIYNLFAKEANDEGFNEISSKFAQIAKIEKEHANVLKQFYQLYSNNELFSRNKTIMWQCQNCGHEEMNTEAPKNCPVCNSVQGYFKEKSK